jgi:hypothetical protein
MKISIKTVLYWSILAFFAFFFSVSWADEKGEQTIIAGHLSCPWTNEDFLIFEAYNSIFSEDLDFFTSEEDEVIPNVSVEEILNDLRFLAETPPKEWKNNHQNAILWAQQKDFPAEKRDEFFIKILANLLSNPNESVKNKLWPIIWISETLAWRGKKEAIPDLYKLMQIRPDIAGFALAKLGVKVSLEEGQIFVPEWENFEEIQKLPEFDKFLAALLEIGKPVGEQRNYYPFYEPKWGVDRYLIFTAQQNAAGGLTFSGKIKDAKRGDWRIEMGIIKDNILLFCYEYTAGPFIQVSTGALEWQENRWALIYWHTDAIS